MKNAFKKIVTLILVVSMLLGVLSTTALAAADTSASGSSAGVSDTVSGGVSTDWCDISYDEKGITVILNTNVASFIGINGAELTEVLGTVVEAVKAIVTNDLMNDILANLPTVPDEDTGNEGESENTGTNSVDVMTIFQNALNTFVTDEYGSAEAEDYIQFLKDLMVDRAADEELVIDRFTSYILRMIRTVIGALDKVTVNDLPAAADVGVKISEIFEQEINARIKAETEKYLLLYVDFLKGEQVAIPDDIKALIDAEVKIYVEAKVNLYISSGFKAPDEADEIDTIIANYMNGEIASQVDEWLTDYASGKAIPANVKVFVDGKIKAWAKEVADSYRDNTTPENPGPMYDVAYGKISDIINSKVDSYISDYLANKAIDSSIESVVDSFLQTEAPSIIYDTYWQYRDNGDDILESAGSLWNTIHKNIRDGAAEIIFDMNPAMPSIDYAYALFDSKSSDEIRTLLGEDNEAEAIASIADEIAAYEQANWVAVWNELSVSTQNTMKTNIKESIKTHDSFKSTVHGLIMDYWVAPTGAAQEEIAKIEANKMAAVAELLALSNYADVLKSLISDAKADYSEIIEDEIANYLGDNTVATLAGVLAALEDEKQVDALTEKVKEEANKKFNEIRAEAFRILLAKSEADVYAKVDVCIDEFLVKYAELVAELKEAEENNNAGSGSTGGSGVNIDLTDILAHIQKISINDTVLYANDAVKLNALLDFIFTLPTFDELKDMSNEEMKLDYDINIVTDFGSTDFNLLVKIEDDFDKVREYSALVSQFLTFDMDESGTIVFDLRIPEKFAELVLKAINSDKIPDDLKHRVFSLFTMTPEDAHAFINDTSLDDILAIFDYVDFDGLLDASFIGATAGLSSAQIKAKIKQYEGYYNKLVSLINSIYNKIPASKLDATILSLYLGDGVLGRAGSYSIEVKALLESFSSHYATLIASFIDGEALDLSFDVSVSFESIRRIDYIIEGETYASGLLPVGADLVYFANVTEYEHFPIVKWVDASGEEITEMPEEDIKLYAVLDKTGGLSASLPESLTSVYSGENVTLTVDLTTGTLAENALITYQWYKNGELIDGATEKTLDLKYVADSGVYCCEVKLFIGDELYGIVNTGDCNVTISKYVIDLEDYTWSPESLVYNGALQYVYLVDDDGNVLTLGTTYVSDGEFTNAAINAGEYTAKVVFDTENVEVIGTPSEFDWQIVKATYDMSGVKFTDKVVPYNGGVQGIQITGTLPEGVTVSYSTEGFVNPGIYEIVASFNGDYNNYNEIDDMTATLRILAFINSHTAYDSEGKVIVDIASVNGILEIYDLNVKDVSTQYGYVVADDIFGAGKVGYVVSAYDIFFTEDGTIQPANDQFTVKMLMPKSLEDTSDALIRIVYIDDNGKVENMQGTREGDYVVFNTTHFSVYAVVVIGDAPVVPVIKDYSWIWKLVVAIAAVLLLLVIIIVVIIKKRKKNGGDDTPTPAPKKEPAPVAPTDAAPVEETASEVVEEAPVEEAPAAEPAPEVVEEAVVEEPAEPVKPLVVLSAFDENGEPRVIDGDTVQIRYRTSFMSRLIQAEAPLQDYYTVVKNALLSYKGVKARTSWNFESFNCGRLQCAKLNVKGSAFQVYLGLDPKEYNANKYHFVDVGDKPKLDKVPMLIKVKSERGLKYALELIEEMMKKYELEKMNIKPKDYHLPYESTEALAAKDLVKVILPSGVSLDDGVNLVKVDVGSMLANTDETEE